MLSSCFTANMKCFFMIYVEKSSDYVKEVNVSKLCGSITQVPWSDYIFKVEWRMLQLNNFASNNYFLQRTVSFEIGEYHSNVPQL